MRTPQVFLLTLGISLVGCKKEQPPPVAPAPSKQVESKADPFEDPGGEAEKAYVLTDEKLSAYAQYLQIVSAAQASLIKDLEKMSSRKDAGAYQGIGGAFVAGKDGLEIVKKRADAEQRALSEVGLTQDEVGRIEVIVTEVISKRVMAKTLKFGDMLTQMKNVRQNLPKDAPKEQLEGVDKSIAEIERQMNDFEQLPEARKRFGDANVDLVLKREAELGKSWEALLSRAGSGPKK